MSHYAVLVFTEPDKKTVEELLDPFYEGLEVPHYISKSDIISGIRKEIEDYKNTRYAEYLKNPQSYLAKCSNPNHAKYITQEFPKRLNWDDEECYREGIKYYDSEDIQPDGSVRDTYNPNSKWDWYTIGGRFSDIIPLKDGRFANEASMSEVDIDYCDQEDYAKSIRFWQLFIDGQTPETEHEKEVVESAFYKREYYTSRYDNAEDFANHCAGFTFYAALLPTGEWLEPGQMGWFGVSFANEDDDRAWRKTSREILKKANENNWNVTVVDCHI